MPGKSQISFGNSLDLSAVMRRVRESGKEKSILVEILLMAQKIIIIYV